MRKILALLMALVVMACTTPTTIEPVVETPETVFYVYDSAWILRDKSEALAASSRDATVPGSLQSYVDGYNAAHMDDQLFITEGEVPIEEAPLANAWIVNRTTYAILSEYLDWPRADLSVRRDIWRAQTEADGGLLFVDKIPPVPEPVIDTRTDYEKWALYLIKDNDGIPSVDDILYEEHLENETRFRERLDIYQAEAMGRADGTYVVSGRLYP